MKTEDLEALLIDRALGQLTPEVESLLADHLATHPEATRIAEQFSDVTSLARTALKEPAPNVAPRTYFLQPAWRRQMTRLLPLAASFAVGATVVLFADRTGAPRGGSQSAGSTTPTPTEALAKAPLLPREIDRETRSLPFWSKKRAYLMAQASESSTH